jgi:hypothetical protein
MLGIRLWCPDKCRIPQEAWDGIVSFHRTVVSGGAFAGLPEQIAMAGLRYTDKEHVKDFVYAVGRTVVR